MFRIQNNALTTEFVEVVVMLLKSFFFFRKAGQPLDSTEDKEELVEVEDGQEELVEVEDGQEDRPDVDEVHVID